MKQHLFDDLNPFNQVCKCDKYAKKGNQHCIIARICQHCFNQTRFTSFNFVDTVHLVSICTISM